MSIKTKIVPKGTSFCIVVSRERLELSTPGLKGPCSNQLSYRPTNRFLVRLLTQLIKTKTEVHFYKLGDLCGSRTRVDGMKTRCTNRYTKRPQVHYTKNAVEKQEFSKVLYERHEGVKGSSRLKKCPMGVKNMVK